MLNGVMWFIIISYDFFHAINKRNSEISTLDPDSIKVIEIHASLCKVLRDLPMKEKWQVYRYR